MQDKDCCKTPNCESDAKCLGLCSACYSYFYYWHKKTPKALLTRQSQIQMYTTRMDMMGTPVPIKHVKVAMKNRVSVESGNMPGTTLTKFKMKPNKRTKAA